MEQTNTTRRFERRFFSKTLGLGLGSILFGALVVGAFYFVGIMPKGLLIMGGAAIPAGILIALSSWGRSCTKCREESVQVRLALPASEKPVAKAAFDKRDSDGFIHLLQTAPKPGAINILEIKVNSCPDCRELVRLKVAGWKEWTMEGAMAQQMIAATKARQAKP